MFYGWWVAVMRVYARVLTHWANAAQDYADSVARKDRAMNERLFDRDNHDIAP